MTTQQETAVLSVFLNGEQAKNEISNLEKKAEDLKNSIDRVGKGSELGKRFARELTEVRNNIKTLQTDVINVDKVLKNLSAAKPKELSATLTALKRQLHFSEIERGSREWNRLQENIRKVREEIKSISAESAVAESRMSRLSNGFNKNFGIIASGIATITGLSFTFRKLAQDIAHLDDVYSDVMKTTGMTHEQVEDLNEAFKKMDTRTSREELNSLARDAGKLGLTAKKDILDFVEAGNQINVALGEDLGDGAIKSIGKIINVFEKSTKDLEGMDLKGQMLAVGSAINELGSKSTASEEFLVSFTGRLGGIATQAGITVDQVLGYASGLDQNMQSLELSATALQQFIMKIMGDPAKFAKIAGMEVRQFSNLLKTDVNGALIAVLKSLQGKGGLQQLIPIFKDMGLDGARASQVLSAMAGNVQQIEEAQRIANRALVEGTSLTKEYGVKNENLQAKLEKAKEEFNESALALGAHLNPLLLKSTNAITYLIKFLPAVIEWFSRYGKIIVSTAVAIGGYSLAMNASVIVDRLKVFWINTVAASLKKLWATMLNNPLGVVIAAATLLFSLYKSLNKELSVNEQKQKALNDVNLTANKSIAEQTVKLERLLNIARDETKSKADRLEAIKKLNEISPEHLGNLSLEEISTNKAKIAIDNYKKSLMQAAVAKATFDKIVELTQQKLDLESKSGSDIYNDNTNPVYKFLGGIANGFGATNVVDNLIGEALKKNKAAIDAIDAQITHLQKLSEENSTSSVETGNENILDGGGGGGGDASGEKEKKLAKQKKRINDEKEKLDAAHLEAMAEIKKKYLAGDIQTEYEYNQALAEQQDKYDLERKNKLNELLKTITDPSLRIDVLKQIADIDQKNYDRQINQANKLKKILLDADPVKVEKQAYENRLRELGLFGINKENMTAEQLEAFEILEKQHQENLRKIDAKGVREKLKELDSEQAAEEAKLAERHRKGLLSEGAYQEALLNLQKEYLKKKLSVPGLSADQTADLNKLLSQNDADTSDSKGKERDAALKKYSLIPPKDVREEAYKMIEDLEARGVLSHEEAIKAKATIDQEYLDSLTDKVKDVDGKIRNVTSNLAGAISGFQEAESMAITKKYDQQIKAAGNNAKKVAKLEEEKEKEKELNKIKAKYADKQFIVTVAQVVSSTAVSAMEAYKAMAGIPVVGPGLGAIAAAAAVAYGASQIAVAKEQRDAAKAGYASGGYTPNGPWDKPQGIVHSEEFVGNRHAVRNPAIRKIFDVIKEAQDNNTVSSLTAKDFARALDYREAENRHLISGISSAVSSSGSNRGNETQILESIAGWLNRNAEVTDRLNRRLDEPFVGEVSITGRKGIRENLDRYEKMIKNASR